MVVDDDDEEDEDEDEDVLPVVLVVLVVLEEQLPLESAPSAWAPVAVPAALSPELACVPLAP